MDNSVINVECVVITALAVGFALAWLLRRLRRERPGMDVAWALAIGYGLRVLVMAGVSLTSLGHTLRGGDEVTFMTQAHQLVPLSLTNGQWLPWNHSSYLHVIVFAAQMKVLGSPEGALRLTQIGFALTGILLIVAAVYDLAGPRAARLAAWLLCLEVSSLLFNQILHKDPMMELASGLLVFGGVKVWRSLELQGMLIMGVAGAIALETRHYVGWFVFAAAIMLALHAALRQLGQGLRSLPIIYGVAAIIFVATPVLLAASSPSSLQQNLQTSQDANATSTKGNGSAGGNNLALEQVNFSSRTALITTLPQRVGDILLRPWPWQLGDVSQMLGAVGSLVALACFATFIRYATILRGEVLRRAGPFLYAFIFLTIAYALAVGNAGTGFRYRSHLVTLALATVAVLRPAVLERRARQAAATPTTRRELAIPQPTAVAGRPTIPAF